MHKKKLLISSLIAVFGIIIYFVSIPTINEEDLVKLTVEAGDEKLLDDVYFNGYLYDYSLFHWDSYEGVTANETLPYLEGLDAAEDQSLRILQKDYPDFINPLLYDTNINLYYVLNSGNRLLSGYFENYEDNYYVDASTVHLNILNKETNEEISEKVERENYPEGDQVDIVGLYEEYPVVKILYTTTSWNSEYSVEKSNLSVGEYNLETKNYKETSLLNDNGNFYDYSSNFYKAKNNKIQIINYYPYNVYDEPEETNGSNGPTSYLYHFVEDTFIPLKDSMAKYFIGNDNQVFSLTNEGEELILRQYNQTGEKVEQETVLDNEFPISLYEEDQYPIVEVINDRLFIAQSATDEISDQKILPTDLQVFDLHSGESLLTGKIDYDTASEVNALEGYIDSIGKMSDF
ncbi:hypothetical protein SAMN02745249_00881 [Atopostipes suicloacalis DSM 15692]|uniref:Uncharacterized protein n=1 Tax=Atopostipes suicloacalis DSM 15692 TaxID=1121025 RepID=A0A1M4VCT7_9LACT|nr:hypothetical protein [Atopostipes suicloacalis]SHE66745.1 hypothetical protein SAMN02745249_00881 [Atopostipes suicloacalis DSM 15692]